MLPLHYLIKIAKTAVFYHFSNMLSSLLKNALHLLTVPVHSGDEPVSP